MISLAIRITASFMSAPGGILMAKLIMPDNPEDLGKEPEVAGEIQFGEEKPANIIMAAAEGAQTGVKLAVAVGAMVLAFVALMAPVTAIWIAIEEKFEKPHSAIVVTTSEAGLKLPFRSLSSPNAMNSLSTSFVQKRLPAWPASPQGTPTRLISGAKIQPISCWNERSG